MLTGLLAVYCGIVVGASLAGGFIPSIVRLGHRRMQMLLSVVGGLMLGVGLLHQLPHSIVIAKDGGAGIDWCVGWMVGGLMLTFFLIRWFHAHSHDAEHLGWKVLIPIALVNMLVTGFVVAFYHQWF